MKSMVYRPGRRRCGSVLAPVRRSGGWSVYAGDRRLQAAGDCGQAPHMAAGADQGEGLHPAGAGGLSLGVDLRPRREAELQKKAWWLANAIVLTLPAGGHNGSSIRTASTLLPAWSSSTRAGPRPTWRPCAAGHRAACGFKVPHSNWNTTTFLAALRHDRQLFQKLRICCKLKPSCSNPAHHRRRDRRDGAPGTARPHADNGACWACR